VLLPLQATFIVQLFLLVVGRRHGRSEGMIVPLRTRRPMMGVTYLCMPSISFSGGSSNNNAYELLFDN
jgi:hypothetical protein